MQRESIQFVWRLYTPKSLYARGSLGEIGKHVARGGGVHSGQILVRVSPVERKFSCCPTRILDAFRTAILISPVVPDRNNYNQCNHGESVQVVFAFDQQPLKSMILQPNILFQSYPASDGEGVLRQLRGVWNVVAHGMLTKIVVKKFFHEVS